ncbi:hypothetical protein EYF80_008585 [Liparis tanakae]|uniref:Uncharacterized protein n=1 Tax=Liparis tanakae TaxID=230148 RepID=A0A4Z2ITV3_9TELE|nr:hypothetical protein EYF80_008585 [Liparis tanakae]
MHKKASLLPFKLVGLTENERPLMLEASPRSVAPEQLIVSAAGCALSVSALPRFVSYQQLAGRAEGCSDTQTQLLSLSFSPTRSVGG